jgi:hypothetical protein
MKITFLQSGGFIGALRGCRLDAALLPVAERAALELLVARCGIEHSGKRFTTEGRDRRQYDLAIEQNDQIVRLSCDDASLPEKARPLVDFLAARAIPQGADFQLPEVAPAERPRRSAMQATEGGEWGRFDGKVVARWEDDGRRMTLVEPFSYFDSRETHWAAPAGSVVDGASIPRAFWSLMGGPFAGEFREASVVHDVACEDRDRPWRAVHRMFYEACRCGGVDAIQAKTMYYAVFHFGPRWHDGERTTIVDGLPQLEPVVRDDTPAPPTEAEAAAIAGYFNTHQVAAEDIPTIEILDPSD